MLCFSPELGLRASIGVFLISCTFLSTTYTTTFAFDHPLSSAVLACFLAGIALLITSRFISYIPKTPSTSHKYSAIPLTERDQASEEVPSSPIGLGDPPSATTRYPVNWIKVAVVSSIGCLRIALYRQVAFKPECAPTGYAYTIPSLVAFYDFWRNQRGQSVVKFTTSDPPTTKPLRVIVLAASRTYHFLCQSRLRYVISALFLTTGGYLSSSFKDGLQSTYVCPIVSGQHSQLQAYAVVNTILDTLIVISAAELSREMTRHRDAQRKQALASWGYSLLGVAVFWTVTGLIMKAATSTDDAGFVTSHYLRSSVGQGLLVTCVVVSASHIIPYYGAVGLCILGGFVLVFFSWTSVLFNGQEPFPPVLASCAFVALLFAFIGAVEYLFSRTASEDEPDFLYRFNVFLRVLFTCLFGIGLILVAHQPELVNLHPIDLLVYDARAHHDNWAKAAHSSNNLTQAVEQYRVKYGQHPPPGFDKWYEYATNRSSVVIDEFDQIYSNLLPFRGLAPQQIREMTQKLATNPYNEVGAVSIRNGSARVQEGIKPTHAWMVSSAAKMMENFAQYLPDMDVVFNLNDEPRIAVPWEKASVLKDQARSQALPPTESVVKEWSADRAEKWSPIEPADQTTETMFTDSSFKNIFDRYASLVCPPSSRARSQRIWDRHSLCLGCTRPHSIGQFPSDWNFASDICHQPDLAYLHGFLISPASFKVTQDLIPLFSQSSISGFNDIMFPSPWNYVDKIKYEPSDDHMDLNYTDKTNDLFWIGSTSEGVSRNGEWKGMPRQRLTHLVNNNIYNKVSVLLPANDSQTFSYQVLDGRAPTETLGLNTTVHLTNVVRCRADCEEQKQELGTSPSVDFQSHWEHRYLFDADGAGFSGRFLPFLQSHSLPFKTGLFRQWFDSRLSPWLHFVPVDLRLHGLWSTLAYFAGVDVTAHGAGPKFPMERHDVEGQWIAEEGRKWAEKALRKEDMEIYFFRLLLEWGRITDDQRDVLGYIP